jgi:hypothetical protein
MVEAYGTMRLMYIEKGGFQTTPAIATCAA